MELEVFAGQERNELSMIEVARAILEQGGRGNDVYFSDLVNEIQVYLDKSDAAIRQALPFFYSDLNSDGSFIPLGDNRWGLRSWYAIDEIDEEILTLEEDDGSKRQKQKVNAFMDEDDEAINYSDDDPEDEDYSDKSSEMTYEEENPDDEKSEVESYDSELNEIIPDDDTDETVDLDEDEDYSSELNGIIPDYDTEEE